jgi:hypothetical protein
MYAGSPNSGIYKIPVANPGSAVDQLVNNFRFGVLRFGRGRSFAGQRNGTTAGNLDKTGLYLSDIDKANLSLYTQTTRRGVGILGGTHDTGTLVAVVKVLPNGNYLCLDSFFPLKKWCIHRRLKVSP